MVKLSFLERFLLSFKLKHYFPLLFMVIFASSDTKTCILFKCIEDISLAEILSMLLAEFSVEDFLIIVKAKTTIDS